MRKCYYVFTSVVGKLWWVQHEDHHQRNSLSSSNTFFYAHYFAMTPENIGIYCNCCESSCHPWQRSIQAFSEPHEKPTGSEILITCTFCSVSLILTLKGITTYTFHFNLWHTSLFSQPALFPRMPFHTGIYVKGIHIGKKSSGVNNRS